MILTKNGAKRWLKRFGTPPWDTTQSTRTAAKTLVSRGGVSLEVGKNRKLAEQTVFRTGIRVFRAGNATRTLLKPYQNRVPPWYHPRRPPGPPRVLPRHPRVVGRVGKIRKPIGEHILGPTVGLCFRTSTLVFRELFWAGFGGFRDPKSAPRSVFEFFPPSPLLGGVWEALWVVREASWGGTTVKLCFGKVFVGFW